MLCKIESINSKNILRVTQLINKTNQFNFTTRRYNESEIKNISESKDYFSLSISLKDKFGDNGIVSVVIVSIYLGYANIELWVMSCRVFKRELEFAVFDEIVRRCISLDISIIKGSYIPTKKNIIIKDFYNLLGFKKLGQQADDTEFWEYIIPKQYTNHSDVMEVVYE